MSAPRLERLRGLIDAREDVDVLIVTAPANVRYLSGFTGSNATLVVGPQTAALLTDFRYIEQAADQSPEFEVVDGGREPRARLLELAGGQAIGFDERDMRVVQLRGLEENLPEGASLVAAGGMVEQLRAVKDADEIEKIAAAALIADSIYVTLAEEGLVGRSESEVAWRIEQLARERGASGLSFDSIVAAGPHGALPHAEPREVAIERGQLVTLDLGVVHEGYCSDCTRTFSTGGLPDDQVEAYELVLAAQETALAGVLPGAECSAVDALARDVIDAAGKGELFGHSLGHGVGIEVHEGPTLSTRSSDKLVAGNVVTVEPGVYLPASYGIRIEDLVVVEEGAPRVLTPFTKQLIEVG